jgi:hypothetical protein
LHQGLTTYSVGDAAAASGFAVLISLVLINSWRSRADRISK